MLSRLKCVMGSTYLRIFELGMCLTLKLTAFSYKSKMDASIIGVGIVSPMLCDSLSVKAA